MKFPKSARDVLKRLRPKHNDITPFNVPEPSETRYSVVLNYPDALKPEEQAARLAHKLQRAAAGKSASILGKRRRHNMGHPNIAIHEDQDDSLHGTRRSKNVTAQEMEHDPSQDDESVEGSYSEDSEESDDEVDESVIEDMRKLEESFKGISQKYRLINRIGEGEPHTNPLSPSFVCSLLQAHSPPCTKPNNSSRMMISIKKMMSLKTSRIPRCHLLRGGRQILLPAYMQGRGGDRRSWL